MAHGEVLRAREAAEEARWRIAELPERGGWLHRGPEPDDLRREQSRLAQAEDMVAARTEGVRALEAELARSGADGPEAEARRERADEIRSELDHRREAQIEAALIEPREYATDALGERPKDGRERRSWERGVRAIEGYRFDHGIRDGDAIGTEPREGRAVSDWHRARRKMETAQRQLGREIELGQELVLERVIEFGP